jgi:RNA polymerase sigma-70 factor, ECF subfamily
MRTLDPHSLSQHVDRLYRAAWALCGSREDAEDLVQETFARVLSRPRILHGDDDLHYLMRVLRNTFLTSRRAASRRPAAVATLDDVMAPDPRATDRPEQALEMQELYAAIASVPEDFRLALVAVDVLGLSYREAARALRVREATVTTRLFRARKAVARRLLPKAGDDDGVDRRVADARRVAEEPTASAAGGSQGGQRPEHGGGPDRGRRESAGQGGEPPEPGGLDPSALDRAGLNRTVVPDAREDKAPPGVVPSRRAT